MPRPRDIGPPPDTARRAEIRAAVKAHDGNQSAAARALGISPSAVCQSLRYDEESRAHSRARVKRHHRTHPRPISVATDAD